MAGNYAMQPDLRFSLMVDGGMSSKEVMGNSITGNSGDFENKSRLERIRKMVRCGMDLF